MRVSRVACSNGGLPFPIHRDSTKYPRMVTEVGKWHYKKESMAEFQNWCRNHQVRAYGNVKITNDLHFARCLRAAKTIYPGQAIITCPYSACFNFLTVAKEISSAESCTFPIQMDWMNYNDRLPYLKSTSTHELATAGWMVRIASLEDSSVTPYIKYLLEDTRGRDGVSNGISREREDASGMIDHYFSELATEACEDPEVFLENLFIAFACIRMRTQPIEVAAIRAYLPGTNFFKAEVGKMFVPTLMPLIDTVVQREDGGHNTVVEYFPYRDETTLEQQCQTLQLSFCPTPNDTTTTTTTTTTAATKAATTTIVSEQCTPFGVERLVRVENDGMTGAPLRGGGFFALRALQLIEKGELLFVRRYPFEGSAEDSQMRVNFLEASRLINYNN